MLAGPTPLILRFSTHQGSLGRKSGNNVANMLNNNGGGVNLSKANERVLTCAGR